MHSASDETAAEFDVQIGEVAAPHGTRGEVRVNLHTDFPERFLELDCVCVRTRSGGDRLMSIIGCRLRPDKNQVILGFAGVNDRESAEALRGAGLWISAEQLVPLEEGTYYEFQIIGLQVRTSEGEELGEVTEIIHTGANEVYVTRRCLIPAISEVIKEIDLERRQIIVEAVPGLLD